MTWLLSARILLLIVLTATASLVVWAAATGRD
jgi:hypothetical protein